MIDTLTKTAIDAVQTTKKLAVDTFVKHEPLAKSLHEFVDAQTEYTKKAIDASISAGTNVYNAITDKSFYTDSLKAIQETVQSFTNTHKKGK